MLRSASENQHRQVLTDENRTPKVVTSSVAIDNVTSLPDVIGAGDSCKTREDSLPKSASGQHRVYDTCKMEDCCRNGMSAAIKTSSGSERSTTSTNGQTLDSKDCEDMFIPTVSKSVSEHMELQITLVLYELHKLALFGGERSSASNWNTGVQKCSHRVGIDALTDQVDLCESCLHSSTNVFNCT